MRSSVLSVLMMMMMMRVRCLLLCRLCLCVCLLSVGVEGSFVLASGTVDKAPTTTTTTTADTTVTDTNPTRPRSALEAAMGGNYVNVDSLSSPQIQQTLNQAHHPFHISVTQSNNSHIMDQKINNMYPIIGIDYYISLCNIIMDRMMENPRILLDFVRQIHSSGIIPVIFIPVEFLIYYLDTLLEIDIPYKLMTLSNFPYCIPYFKFPQMCSMESSNADVCIRVNYVLYSKHLLAWYTKNPCIVHPKLVPLPIGPKWQHESFLFFGEDVTNTSTFLLQIGLSPYAYFKNMTDDVYLHYQRNVQLTYLKQHQKDSGEGLAAGQQHAVEIRPPWFAGKDKLLYVNFNEDTTATPFYGYHQHKRKDLLIMLQAQGFEIQSNTSFQEYMFSISQYQFCVAPPGLGIDTHRTWEALMMGTIPIVLTSPLDSLYDDLPVLIVQDYSLITEKILREVYQVIHNQDNLNFAKLYMDYWRDVIQSAS